MRESTTNLPGETDKKWLLRDAVLTWGEIAWARGGEGLKRPPFFVWRFADDACESYDAVAARVGCFEGAVDWVVIPGRNWAIQPAAVGRFCKAKAFKTDVHAGIAFGTEFPDVVELANGDVYRLAEWIKKREAI